MNLQGRNAIITGASQGLGEAIAQAYVEAGAHVVLAARDQTNLNAVTERLVGSAGPSQKILSVVCDVTDRQAVDAMVDFAIGNLGSVEILVNNAGVYGPIGPLESNDIDEWVQALEINLLGTVYPTRAMIPNFKHQKYGKVINISGGGATAPLPRFSAYAASKAAVVRFTETMAEELKSFRIDVNAVAPGALMTKLTQKLLDAGPEQVGTQFFTKISGLVENGGTPLAIPASLCVYLGSAESDGISGRLLAAVWDNWRELAQRRDVLGNSDIYTLRRILPSDRGQDWGDK